MIKSLAVRLRQNRFCRDRRGVAAVEGALTAPFFGVLILGIMNIGVSAKDHGEVREAIRAGVHAAMSDVTDTTTIQNIVYSTLGASQSRARVTTALDRRCNGTTVHSPNCTDGTTPDEFIQISVNVYEDSTLSGSPKISENIEVRAN